MVCAQKVVVGLNLTCIMLFLFQFFLHLSKLSNDIKAKSPKNKAENLSFAPVTSKSYIYVMIAFIL